MATSKSTRSFTSQAADLASTLQWLADGLPQVTNEGQGFVRVEQTVDHLSRALKAAKALERAMRIARFEDASGRIVDHICTMERGAALTSEDKAILSTERTAYFHLLACARSQLARKPQTKAVAQYALLAARQNADQCVLHETTPTDKWASTMHGSLVSLLSDYAREADWVEAAKWFTAHGIKY